ncbi:MAG: HigA family addiction module antitoxin [Candidatus Methylumidiphilus sp.]
MTTNTHYISDLAIPPGEYLQEVIDELGMNQTELAKRMGRPTQMINEIVRGEKAITPKTAIQLEDVTSVPSHIWNGLEAEYRLILAKQNEEQNLASEASLVAEFPYVQIAKLGFLKKTSNTFEKVTELRRFFGVASLYNLETVDSYEPAFRQGKGGKASSYALIAWLRMAEIKARAIECASFGVSQLRVALPHIRMLTQEPLDVFLPRLSEMLKKCGVAFILQPHLAKTYAHGATFFLGKKAVLVMSIRGAWADVFWFSLFHEIGHILLHSKRQRFVENDAIDPALQKQENEADAFAREILIPSKHWQAFVRKGEFSPQSIQGFADEIGIAPGIVTGFLRHHEHLPMSNHTHRVQYQWVEWLI